MKMNKNNLKQNQILVFGLVIVLIAVVNVISSFVFTRFDLTSEKRYTLSPATKDILRGLDDYVTFKVYLDGEFPADFKQLRRETKEMLDEFRAYNRYIEYEFIDPSDCDNEAERREMFRILAEKGLTPTQINIQTNSGTEQIIVWPQAVVSYRNNKELVVELLEQQSGKSSETTIKNSIQNLEYKLIDAIKKTTAARKPSIAFIEGHGELTQREVYDITQTLAKNYVVDRITLDEQIGALTRRSQYQEEGDVVIKPLYDAIIIAKPTKPFSEKDKFIIDQYIMYGGKVLWLVEPVFATMDSLQYNESTVGISLDLNLDDQLFRYGVKLNKNILLDLNAAPIAIRTGQVAGQPQIEYFKWYYFPLLTAVSKNPIAVNINPVKADFVSSMEATTSTPAVRKTPLLRTSNYSKVVGTPAYITMALLKQNPDERMFPQPSQNVAYLLSGNFQSLYHNRIPPEIADSKEVGFRDESQKTSMIVVSDGDIIRNQFHIRSGTPLQLGYDQYTDITYGNKDFILNAISYLVDGEGLIGIRSRELKIRLLDSAKVSSQRVQWQVINVVAPTLLVVIAGTVAALIRKKKYSRKSTGIRQEVKNTFKTNINA